MSSATATKIHTKPKQTAMDRSTKASTDQKISFTESLRDQMESGKSVVDSIRLYAHTSSNAKLSAAFTDIALHIDRGMYIPTALALYPRIFGAEYCALIGAAERSGNWTKRRGQYSQQVDEGILDLIIRYLKRSDTARQKVQAGLIYPAIVVLFVLGAIVIFGIYVVPAFKEIFAALEAPPSTLTWILFGTSDFVIEHYALMPIALLLSIVGLVAFWRAKGHQL